MRCLLIALTIWLLPTVTLIVTLAAVEFFGYLKSKSYYRPMAWLMLSLLVALVVLTVIIFVST